MIAPVDGMFDVNIGDYLCISDQGPWLMICHNPNEAVAVAMEPYAAAATDRPTISIREIATVDFYKSRIQDLLYRRELQEIRDEILAELSRKS